MSTTSLNGDGVLRQVYDPATESLKTLITANISGAQEVIINATDDSVRIGDGAGHFMAVNNDGSINVSGITAVVTGTVDANLNGLAAFQTSQYAISTTAVHLTPTPLANRSSMSIKAVIVGSANVYIGNSSGVTTSTGYILFNGDSIQLDLEPTQVVYAIASAPGQTVYVMEIGG